MSGKDVATRAKVLAALANPEVGVSAVIEWTTGRIYDPATGRVSGGSTTTVTANVAPLTGSREIIAADGARIRKSPATTIAAGALSFEPSIGEGKRLDIVIGTERFRAHEIEAVRMGTQLLAFNIQLERV